MRFLTARDMRSSWLRTTMGMPITLAIVSLASRAEETLRATTALLTMGLHNKGGERELSAVK